MLLNPSIGTSDVDNHPVITLLTIITTSWDNSNSEPRLEVLVQCPSLAPDDTTWEELVTLKNALSP